MKAVLHTESYILNKL